MPFCVWAAEACCTGCTGHPECVFNNLRTQVRVHPSHCFFINCLSSVLLLAPSYVAQIENLFLVTQLSGWETLLCNFFPLWHAVVQCLLWEKHPTAQFEYVLPPGRHHFPVCFQYVFKTLVKSLKHRAPQCTGLSTRTCVLINTLHAACRNEDSLG